MILGDSPIVALSDVGNSRLLAVVAVIARDILANTAQEQAHVFRATMMLPTGCLTGVPCCAGAGSRGIKLRPHAAIFQPRGPSAGHRRPSRPYGLRSLTRNAGSTILKRTPHNLLYFPASTEVSAGIRNTSFIIRSSYVTIKFRTRSFLFT